MARTKTSPGTAPSAAHAATETAPAPGTAPAADSPAAAVHGALAANPGGTVGVIADAAGTGKPVARAALLAMEADGTATRVKGTKPGIPDTWTLAGPAPDGTGPADPEAGQVASPVRTRAAAQTLPARTRRPTAPGRAALSRPATTPRAKRQRRRGRPRDGKPGPRDDAPAEDDHEEHHPGQARRGAAPGNGGPQDRDGAARGRPGGLRRRGRRRAGPGPRRRPDRATRPDQGRRRRRRHRLDRGGDLHAALAGLDEIYEQAAQARRSLKAAVGGRKAPAVRPGGLRDKVLAHLDAHPGGEFTPHEIHKVIDHSSGAIANALETLVKLGEAEVATEKPRRFRRAASGRRRPRGGQRGQRAGRRHGTGGCRVTTPASSRGGSTPPGPPAAKPQQWFMLRAWLFDITAATGLLRAAPRLGQEAAGHALGCSWLTARPSPGHTPASRHSERYAAARPARPAGRPRQAERRTGHDRRSPVWHNVAHDAEGPAHRDAGRLPARPSPWSASSPTRPIPAGGPRRRSPRRRSPSATATPATPAARSCPAATTHASCGRYPSPESKRVVADHVALCRRACCPARLLYLPQ